MKWISVPVNCDCHTVTWGTVEGKVSFSLCSSQKRWRVGPTILANQEHSSKTHLGPDNPTTQPGQVNQAVTPPGLEVPGVNLLLIPPGLEVLGVNLLLTPPGLEAQPKVEVCGQEATPASPLGPPPNPVHLEDGPVLHLDLVSQQPPSRVWQCHTKRVFPMEFMTTC